jgi:hypothetical protein
VSQEHPNQTPDKISYTALGIAIGAGAGVALGVALGAAMHNMGFMGVGVAIGVGVGLPIGAALDQRNKDHNVRRDRKKMDQKGVSQ